MSHQFDFRDSFIIHSFISDTFTFVGFKYKLSVIQVILWSMLSKVFISFRFRLPNGQEDHAGESRGQLITSLLASRTSTLRVMVYTLPLITSLLASRTLY